MSEIMSIQGIPCYEKDGVAYLNLETVARGLGFIKVDKKDSVEYERVNKQFMKTQLQLFGILSSESDPLPEYIPENIFYRLAMKARNETAEKFQAFIADEVVPAIRKTGMYATAPTIDKILADPDYGISLLMMLKEERQKSAKLADTVAVQAQQIKELKPKAIYYDKILQSPSVLPISVIAKDYGMSARKMNQLLADLGVQYKQGTIWLLKQKYAGYGYTQTKTHLSEDGHVHVSTYWTQSGRLFLYDLLKGNYILPLIEQN